MREVTANVSSNSISAESTPFGPIIFPSFSNCFAIVFSLLSLGPQPSVGEASLKQSLLWNPLNFNHPDQMACL